MIGAIADDITGGTDVAVALRRAGLHTALYFGVPGEGAAPGRDATVIALKTRTVAPQQAVQESLSAARWLERHGASQLYFKYCSTFDSTPQGNIGPVADALAAHLGASTVLVVPASPEHLRTQFMGHLFVDRVLLSDSHMRHHPLTPMTDSRVAELLQGQTTARVALVTHPTVRAGREEIARAVRDHSAAGVRYVVVDAVDDHDLLEIAHACSDHRLVTGAAGLAGGIGRAGAERLLAPIDVDEPVPDADPASGRSVVLAGSCSARTLEQVDQMRAQRPAYRLDVLATADPDALSAHALTWYDGLDDGLAPLIYSSSAPAELQVIHDRLGVEEASRILEDAMGRIAVGLRERGVRRYVVAGGETSGSVVAALGVPGGLVGTEAAPGVPWVHAPEHDVTLLLKSGNFGDRGLLVRASATRHEKASE